MSNYNQLNEDGSQNQSANMEQQLLNNNANAPDQVNVGGEVEMQAIKKVNPRDYLPDPRIQKKKKALSLQAQKKLIEEKNKKEIEMAILKRIIFRIFAFFVYMAFIIMGFIAIYLYLAYIRSSTTMPLNSNIELNVDNCMLTIYDDSSLGENMKIEFNIPGTFDLWLGESSSLTSSSYVDDDSGLPTYNYTVENILTMESCQISMYLGSGSKNINNFKFNCIDGSCVFVSYSKNLTITNMTYIQGTEVYLNLLTINTSTFTYVSTSGLAQFNHFNVSQDSYINLTAGNIVLQATGDYLVNWTSRNPSYCISAPLLSSDYNVTGCERVRTNIYGELVVATASEVAANSTDSDTDTDTDDDSDSSSNSSSRLLFQRFLEEIPIKSVRNNHKKSLSKTNVKTLHHLADDDDSDTADADTDTDTDDETDDADDTDDDDSDDEATDVTEDLPDSCWGRVALCSESTESCSSSDDTTLPVVYIWTSTGALYANIIPEIGLPAAEANQNLKSVIYDDGTVGWSVSTLLDLTTDYDDSQEATSFDPVFLVKIGNKESNSSLFQQWVITYAPAYTYVRPWWIGTYSLTLLSTNTYEIQADLNPGFCPYTPGLTLSKLSQVQDMMKLTFLNESSGIFSFTYPSDSTLPGLDIDYNATNYGFRDIPATVGSEYWISISKENSTYYDITYEDLSQSSTIQAAVILSAVIGVLVGIYLMIGAVYGIITIYIDIIEIVTSTSKYAKIEQKDDPGAYQPLMNTKKGKKLQAEGKTKEEVPEISYNPLDMFRQLFVLAPPMSAFVDFLCVYMSKKYINSAEVFFFILFVEHQSSDDDEELHDLDKERISGTEMKTLYEKFCYLNGYLEQKLDDDDIATLMDSTYGFKIVTKNDSQTLYFTRVMLLSDDLPKLGKDKDKTVSSMSLFIEMCCKVSKFDSDTVPVLDFNSQYKNFCMINYLNVESPSVSEMSTKYGIGNSFLSQQWIVRSSSEAKTVAKTGGVAVGEDKDNEADSEDKKEGGDNADAAKGAEEKKESSSSDDQGCIAKIKSKLSIGSMNTPKIYYIDRKRLNNHFYLLMQLPEKIETSDELMVANKELILFPGWLVVDLFTVLFHILTILVLMVPVLGFFLLENILYSDFSLSPDKDLITTEDITNNIWDLPNKLYSSSLWIKILVLVVLIFWLLGFIDLLYYYMKMEFPQDKFFRKTRSSEAAFLQILFRRMMWVLVLISLWCLGSYVALAMVWMILGAVINPTAFLPYAAGAGTFITVVTTKYSEFMSLAENALKKVVDYIKSLTQGELNEMLKKMGLGGGDSDSGSASVSSDTVTAVADVATNLGIADTVTADPKTDPAAYVKELKEKMQAKAKEVMTEKFNKILVPKDQSEDLSAIKEGFINVVTDIMKQDSSQLKTHLHDLLSNMNGQGILNMPEGLISLLWEFAFMDVKLSSEDFLMTIVDPIAGFIIDQLVQKDMWYREEFNKDILSKIMNIVQSIQNKDTSSVVTDLNDIINKVYYFNSLKKYHTIFKIAISLLDGTKINYHQIFKLLKLFVKEMEIEDEIVDFFELLLNAFNHQAETPSIRDMNMTIEKFVRKTIVLKERDRSQPGYKKAYQEFKDSVRSISYNLTILFAFLYHQFESIPKEILRNIIGFMQNELREYFPDEKYYKNIVPILQAGYETIGCFLDDPSGIMRKFETNASSFGISQSKAHQIKVMCSIKYKELYPGREIYQVQNLQLWKDIVSYLQISPKLLLGLFGFITLRFDDIKEINDLVNFMLKLGKVDVEQRSKVLDIFKLYASDNESDISTAATNLGIPRIFVSLILIAKKILDPKFVTDMEWIELGLDNNDSKLLDDRYSVFNDEKKFEKWRSDVADKLAKVNDKIMEGNDDGPAKKTLLLLSCTGLITKQKIKDDLDTLSTNKNKIAQFTEYQFDLLQNMINSRAIDRTCTSNFDSDSKTGIIELAKAINLDEPKLDKLLTLWFLTRSDKIFSAIREFSPDFVEYGEEENYENYITYVYGKMNIIAKKENFVKGDFLRTFNVKIPKVILNKSLFNTKANIDLNTMYEMLSFPLNSLILEENNELKYRNFDECLISLSPLVKYLTSHMEVQHIMLIRKIFNIEHEGIADLLMILNETSQTNSLTLFLDHIDKYCGEAMKFFVCLLAFFQGKSNNVEIINSEMQKVSIRTYISELIYPELLDAIYALFMKEAADYSDYMIKYFRRVEACKATNLGGTSLQSLVKIPIPIMENFLKLVNGDDYNAQVISKEIGLSTEAIEFGSGLTRIMNANNKEETITTVCSNSDFKSALSKINVKPSELMTIFKLCYGCYDNDNIKWIIDSLNLDKYKIGDDESVIKCLLAMDQVLDISADAQKNWVTLQKKFTVAEPLLEAKAMNLDKEMVMVASFLLHGDFTLILKMAELPQFNFLFPKSQDILPEYNEFLMGLCGTISHRSEEISINTLFRKYYNNLKKGIQTTDPDYMNPTSSRPYAVFCLFKSLDISPIWTFLYLADINVWNYVWELYYDNVNYKDPFLNPLLILMIILNYIETPTPFKEIIYDNEYLTNYCTFLRDPAIKELKAPVNKSSAPTNINHNPEVIEESWKGYSGTSRGLTELLWANWSKTKDRLEELTKTHLSNDILNFWPDKEKNFSDDKIAEALKQAALMSIRKQFTKEESEEVDKFCVDAANSSESLESFLKNYENIELREQMIQNLENIFPSIIKNVINTVTAILEDPRDTEEEEENPEGKPKSKKFYETLPRIQKYFEDNSGNEFTMCSLATIVELRNAYFNLHDLSDRGEDHYKLFTYKLDFLLSMIEKNNFHKNFMNSFSKYRVMQLVGLSAGFCIRGEHLIRANVTKQFNDWDFQRAYTKLIPVHGANPKKLNYFIVVEKMKKIWSVLKDFKEARSNRYFRIYNLATLETAIENENYYEINTEPENIIFQSYPGHSKFKWAPFVFDVMTCNSLMDYNDDDFDFDSNIIESRLRYVMTGGQIDRIDLRSGAEWKNVVKNQNLWNTIFDSDEYLMLVNIFRGNYAAVLESNTYFTIRYPEISAYCYGLLGLNASANWIQENNYTICENYITAIGGQMTSNRKSLNEIVKFLYGHAETVKKFSSSFGDNEQVFECFMKVSASTLFHVPDISSAQYLISKISGLTALEIEVFKKILEVSQGATGHLDELVKYSNQKKGLTDNAAKAFSNLVNNLDQYSLQSEENMDPEFFNIRDKTSYSINIQKNSFNFYLELYKIAVFQFPDTVSDQVNLIHVPNCDMFGEQGDEEDRTKNQKENLKKKDRFSLLFQIINNILDGDFSAFFVFNSKDFFDILRILNLGNNENDLKCLRVVASLKPNKLNPRLIKYKPEKLDLESRAKEFNEMNVISLPEGLDNKEELEGKLSSLILGLQYWNIVEILKGLEGDQNEENKEIYCLMQSFFVWKNLSPILSCWNELNEKDSKAKIDPKVIGTSLKVFLGKILQTIKTTVDAKKNKKGAKSPTKIGGSSIKEVENTLSDKHYTSILSELKQSKYKLNHAFVNGLNAYKQKNQNTHFLDWMLSLSAIFSKSNQENDPISKIEPYFTGRFLKKIGKDETMKFTVNFCLQSYTTLFNKQKAIKNVAAAADKKPEESAAQTVGPMSYVLNLPTSIYLLNPYKKTEQQFNKNLMSMDFFMRLCVILQKKGKGNKPSEEVLVTALGTFKMVMLQIDFGDKIDLAYNIIKLLTGYNIAGNQVSNKKSDDLVSTLYKVFQEAFDSNWHVKTYVTNDVLTNMNKYLTHLSQFNVKTIADPKFVSTIIDLLCSITGTNREEAEKARDEKSKTKPGAKAKTTKTAPVLAKGKSQAAEGQEENEEEVRAEVLFELPIAEIEAIFKITQLDVNSIEELLMKHEGCDAQKIRIFTKMHEQVTSMNVYGKTVTEEADITKAKAGESELAEIMKKIQNGTATTHEVFVATDREGDSSGAISKQEFSALARRLNINLTDHRVNEIFASLKKSGTSNNDEELNEEEFAKAMEYLNEKSTNMTVESLGVSKSLLMMALISLIIVLLLLFVFIFLGIQGFAVGSSFGSVVNSLLPISAGAGTGGGKDEDKEKQTSDETLGSAVEKSKTILQTNSV